MKLTDILLDIEGTTSSIHFVHEVLFPYAKAHLRDFIGKREQDPSVQEALALAARSLGERGWPNGTTDEVVAGLERYIELDVKDTALKNLQGMVWEKGYREGAYKAHLYPEVSHYLKAWFDAGFRLSIYSSGSIWAQKLFFGHTIDGNLLPLLSKHFDTTTGPKKETASYQKIADTLQGEGMLFLSDVTDELDAASKAGFRTGHILRPGTEANSQGHPAYSNFEEVDRAMAGLGRND